MAMASGLADWRGCVSEVKGRLEGKVGLRKEGAGRPPRRGKERRAGGGSRPGRLGLGLKERARLRIAQAAGGAHPSEKKKQVSAE